MEFTITFIIAVILIIIDRDWVKNLYNRKNYIYEFKCLKNIDSDDVHNMFVQGELTYTNTKTNTKWIGKITAHWFYGSLCFAWGFEDPLRDEGGRLRANSIPTESRIKNEEKLYELRKFFSEYFSGRVTEKLNQEKKDVFNSEIERMKNATIYEGDAHNSNNIKGQIAIVDGSEREGSLYIVRET